MLFGGKTWNKSKIVVIYGKAMVMTASLPGRARYVINVEEEGIKK